MTDCSRLSNAIFLGQSLSEKTEARFSITNARISRGYFDSHLHHKGEDAWQRALNCSADRRALAYRPFWW